MKQRDYGFCIVSHFKQCSCLLVGCMYFLSNLKLIDMTSVTSKKDIKNTVGSIFEKDSFNFFFSRLIQKPCVTFS